MDTNNTGTTTSQQPSQITNSNNCGGDEDMRLLEMVTGLVSEYLISNSGNDCNPVKPLAAWPVFGFKLDGSPLCDDVAAVVAPPSSNAGIHDASTSTKSSCTGTTCCSGSGCGGGRNGKLMEIMRRYLYLQPCTRSPGFSNQLYSCARLPGLMAAIVSTIHNTSIATFEVSPVATMMEHDILQRTALLLGWTADADTKPDGVMTSGGSNSNLMAMLCARYRVCPQCNRTGWANAGVLTCFVSTQAHYSFEKAALTLGLGLDNVRKVASDDRGRMIPAMLDDAIHSSIERGEKPFIVCATAGSTVLGAFDPILEIAAITKKYNLWLHVDGAWGGPVLFSQNSGPTLLRGINLADSFTIDFHKLLGVPLMAAVFVTKHKQLLLDSVSLHSNTTSYQLHAESEGPDTGTKSLATARVADAFKLWMTWKVLGDSGFGAAVDRAMSLARELVRIIRSEPELELLNDPQFVNVCFRFIGTKTACSTESTGTPQGRDEYLNDLNLRARKLLMQDGRYMVNYAYVIHGSSTVLAFRYVCVSCALEPHHLPDIVAVILICCREAATSLSDSQLQKTS
ncbi:aspartate aminotransferase family protein [Pelomyxa schiedti]|nr:aspartate aminotransferase family protein [Pelomyxa schiedti]